MMRKSTLSAAMIAGATVLIVADAASAYYSPKLGRFLGRDPIGEPGAMVVRRAAASTQFIPRDPNAQMPSARNDLEIYTFGHNDPIGQIDPLGLDRYLIYDGSHLAVAVDEWECRNGKWVRTGRIYRFDYSVDWNSWGWPVGIVAWYGVLVKSKISSDDLDSLEYRVLGGTACDDKLLLDYLLKAEKDPPVYGLFWNNCQDFAQRVFYIHAPPDGHKCQCCSAPQSQPAGPPAASATPPVPIERPGVGQGPYKVPW